MNSNYSKIQINLLPSELKPGPSVRFGVLLTFLFIAATLAFILVDSVVSLNRLASYKEANQLLEQEIAKYEVNESYYNELKGIEEKVNSYGRLISLASVDYVEMPLIMERMSSIVPDGVYLRSVSNDKPNEGTNFVVMRFQLSASTDDPELLRRTLEAFKKDKYLNDCYMSVADRREQGIQDRLQQFGIDWGVSGSGEDGPTLLADLIEFEIQARVARPLDTEGMARIVDNSSSLTEIKFLVPPPKEDKTAKRKTNAQRKAEERAAAETGGLPPQTEADGGGQ